MKGQGMRMVLALLLAQPASEPGTTTGFKIRSSIVKNGLTFTSPASFVLFLVNASVEPMDWTWPAAHPVQLARTELQSSLLARVRTYVLDLAPTHGDTHQPLLSAMHFRPAALQRRLPSSTTRLLDIYVKLFQRRFLSPVVQVPNNSFLGFFAVAFPHYLAKAHEYLQTLGLQSSEMLLYLQSGDTGDFDGYTIAAALHRLNDAGTLDQRVTSVILVPERIACQRQDSQDPMEHDPEYAASIVEECGKLLRLLAGPEILLVKGGLNEKNLFLAPKQFSELQNFIEPLRKHLVSQDPKWSDLADLAKLIISDEVDKVIIDGNGSLGYLRGLCRVLGPSGVEALGRKMRACGAPMPIMNGVLAEVQTTTLRMANRDPRATMNAIYSPEGIRLLLDIAKEHDVPLLFVTNNTCNRVAKYQNWKEILPVLGIADGEPDSGAGDDPDRQLRKSIMRTIATGWYSQAFLGGNYIFYDWLCFCTMLDTLKPALSPGTVIETRQLYYNPQRPEILVIRAAAASAELSEVERQNLEGTVLYGPVQFLMDMDKETLHKVACELI